MQAVGETELNNDSMIHRHLNGRHYVSCKVCSEHTDVVRIHVHRGRLPAITTETGTIYRKNIVDDHLKTPWHSESVKCSRLKKLAKVEKAQQAPMVKMISKANETLANKIGRLMVTVFNDAKKLTLSAHSWPSRMVATQKAASFNMCNTSEPTFDLQYITPIWHSDFLGCIVDAHRQDILNKLIHSKALSLRLDGSVDRTQVDKIYVLAKIIDKNGAAEEVFLGAAEPEQRGAVGVLLAVKQALFTNFGSSALALLKHVSSVVTDGASVNIGEKNGFWTLLESERKSSESDKAQPSVPLIKIWCAVHRSQLAWQAVSDTVIEVKHCFQQLIGLVSYFHTSGVRTRELKKLADDNHFQLRRLPTVYEVRWTEFSYALLDSVLVSWKALVSYLKQSKDVAAVGHANFLTSFANLQLLVFLADVLFVYARFQKRLQSDSTTLVDLNDSVYKIKSTISKLKTHPVTGGWQETLNDSVTDKDGDKILADIRISLPVVRRKKHHLYVSDRRDVAAIQNEIVESLVEFITQRFSIDESLFATVIPLVRFDQENVDLRAVHRLIGCDLDLAAMSLEYAELASSKTLTSLKLPQLVERLALSDDYPAMLTILARILAAKPHSADVERCISANNLLKTTLRARLNMSTENAYLFIHHNLPNTSTWDPRSSVLRWLSTPRRQKPSLRAKHQRYYRHVFSEADERECKHDPEEVEERDVESSAESKQDESQASATDAAVSKTMDISCDKARHF